MISASLAYPAPCPPPLMSRWSTFGWSSPWPSLSLKWLCTPTKRPSSWSWTSSGSRMTSPLQCLPKSNQWNDSSLSTRPKKMFKGLLAIKSICFDFYGKVEKENDILWASFGQGAPFCSNRSFLSFSLSPSLHNLKISKPFRNPPRVTKSFILHFQDSLLAFVPLESWHISVLLQNPQTVFDRLKSS